MSGRKFSVLEKLVVVVFVAAIGLVVLLREVLEPRLLLHPTRVTQYERYQGYPGYTLKHLPSSGVLADLPSPPNKSPNTYGENKKSILILHGNAGCINDVGGLVERFHKRGYHVFALEYHGFGVSRSTNFPTPDGILQDMREAWKEIALRFPSRGAKDTIVLGFSLGGGVIGQWLQEVDKSQFPKQVVLLNTFASLPSVAARLVHQSVANVMKTKWHSQAGLERYAAHQGNSPRMLVVATIDDHMMAPNEGQQLAKWAGKNSKLIILPDGGHMDSIFRHSHMWLPFLA